jgi:hypothetical protein
MKKQTASNQTDHVHSPNQSSYQHPTPHQSTPRFAPISITLSPRHRRVTLSRKQNCQPENRPELLVAPHKQTPSLHLKSAAPASAQKSPSADRRSTQRTHLHRSKLSPQPEPSFPSLRSNPHSPQRQHLPTCSPPESTSPKPPTPQSQANIQPRAPLAPLSPVKSPRLASPVASAHPAAKKHLPPTPPRQYSSGNIQRTLRLKISRTSAFSHMPLNILS